MACCRQISLAILAAISIPASTVSGQLVGSASAQFTVATIGPYSGSSFFLSYGYGYPFGYGYWPYYDGYGGFGLPPLFISAESIYGPQALQKFWGIDNPPPLIARPADPGIVDPMAPADVDQLRAKIKPTNAETKAQARKFLSYGDAHFAANRFHEAAQRYRTAAIIAPDLPEAAMREGFAAVAMRQYTTGEKAIRRALILRPDWSNSAFKLEQLFQDARIKTAQLELLAKVVDENPDQPSPLFLLGIELFFDGQIQRGQVFLERAAQLGANSDHLLDPFLPAAPVNAVQQLPAPGPPAPGPAAPAPKPVGVVF